MNSRLNRRDFLKLAGALPLGYATSQAARSLGLPNLMQQDGRKNVLVLVFDAWSAYNISLHGYQRETMPNLARLAERAIVYHNHFSASNFTSSGTASLLTGTLPWTHRALRGGDEVAQDFVSRSIFSAFKDYYRITYTHNGWANTLLEQFQADIDELVPWKSLFLRSYDGFIHSLFKNDDDSASVAWTRNMNVKQDGYSYSLFLSHLYGELQKNRYADLKQTFPRGIPSTGDVGSEFLLESAIDWTGSRLPRIPQPFVGYFHFLPPHGPYNAPIDYIGHFESDNLRPLDKPQDLFTARVPYSALLKRRAEYDEFILYVDREFGRLFDQLESAGLLQNTVIALTTDHGEMNERGISGHSTNALYQPVIRVPLLIFDPDQPARVDVHTPTSAVDLLPTLLHLTGQPIPDWTEGVVLPPYAEPTPGRSVYAVKASKNGQFDPLAHASVALIKDNHKLIYYFGYQERGVDELVQLYDIQADPEEMTDLSTSQKNVSTQMLDELKTKLEEVNKPYIK